MSTLSDGIDKQHQMVILRSVQETVGTSQGSTPDDVYRAIERVSLRLLSEVSSSNNERSTVYIIPEVVKYSPDDLPLLPAKKSKIMPLDYVAGIIRRIAQEQKYSVSDAQEITRRISAITAPSDLVEFTTGNSVVRLGTGEPYADLKRLNASYDMERVPSPELLGEHVARRVSYGWGNYDINFMEGVLPAGKALISFSFGFGGSASQGVQKLINKVVLWLFTERGSHPIHQEYGSSFLSNIFSQDIVKARAVINTELSNLTRLWLDDINAGLPDVERLSNLVLESIDVQGGSIRLKVRILTAAGDSVPVVLPIKKPEIVYGY